MLYTVFELFLKKNTNQPSWFSKLEHWILLAVLI